jgi:hypothetical protein
MRNIFRRLMQRFACSCKLRVPFPFPGPGDRGRELLRACGLNKARPIGSRLSQPAVIEETIESVGRPAGREQNRHRKFRSEQSSFLQRLSEGI